MLLTALSHLRDHPLQDWAKERSKGYQENLSTIFRAYEQQASAARIRDKVKRRQTELQAEITVLNGRIQEERDNPSSRETLQTQVIKASQELALISGDVTVATFNVDEVATRISRVEQGFPTLSSSPGRVETITAVVQRAGVALIEAAPSDSIRQRAGIHVQYLQAALLEFGISDAKLIAAILANLAHESNWFQNLEELGAGYEGRVDLGNTQAGDGPRFKGRGYLKITGRANYRKMNERLGLGSRLEDSPADASNPEVAARISIAWIVDRQNSFVAALANDDLSPLRRTINGGLNGLANVSDIYAKVINKL